MFFFIISWNISQNSNCLNLGGLFSCSVVWGFSGVNRYVFWFHFQMLLMLYFVCVCLAVECAWDLLVAAVLRMARVFVLAMFVVYALQVSLALLNSCLFFFFLRTWMLFLWLESMILIMDLWRPFRLSGSCICLVIFTCWFPNLSRFQLLEVCLFFSSSSFLLLLCFLRHWFIVLGDYFGWFYDVCLHMAWYCLGILLFFHVFFFSCCTLHLPVLEVFDLLLGAVHRWRGCFGVWLCIDLII